MDWKWDLLKSLITVSASGYLGFVLGLRVKRPFIIADFIKVSDKETYVRLNNIGESPAREVQLEDVALLLKLGPNEPFNEKLNGSTVVFKFEKVPYIEPHTTKDAIVSVSFNGEGKSDSVRKFYSYSLKRFKQIPVKYKDNFGFRYTDKLIEPQVNPK
ncbi:MAG: hypothetical protein HQL12_09160 [Candidatus Omnitrophica bacterium]|nr:hypothetical protein [Candidatus Omnitrophota bacterium]